MSAGPAPGSASVRHPLAAETVRLYGRDWADFVAWCRSAGVRPVPATPADVACYLATLAGTLSRGALNRRLAAIAHQHRQHETPAPALDPDARKTLRAAGRSVHRRRKTAPTAHLLPRMVRACPGDLGGLRDRAVLLLMAAIPLRRAELVGLEAEQVRFTAIGVELSVATENVGAAGRVVMIEKSVDRLLCPVLALEDWLRASDTRFGPVFRKVDRWGNVEHRALGSDAVRRILARRALLRRRSAPENAA